MHTLCGAQPAPGTTSRAHEIEVSSAPTSRYTRRRFLGAAGFAAAGLALRGGPANAQQAPDFSLAIGPCTLDASPHHTIRTVGYNNTIPGPLLRLREGRSARVAVVNNTPDPEIVHWHGLFQPSLMDGASEEGSPMIPPGGRFVYEITPRPAGFRWYHTHTMAGGDLKKAQYTGQHGFLFVEPASDPGAYDAEHFLALHDWRGELIASDDGAMNPVYSVSTINGRMLGFGDPIQVRQGQRVLFHILNSSATEVHWLSFSGHTFRVIALDGNPVPQPREVKMLRLAPAERVCAVVTMNNPGVWVLGEPRKHVQAAGMGTVVEYAGAGGKPVWQQPESLDWNYEQFGEDAGDSDAGSAPEAEDIPLVLSSRFQGHGAMERWQINGKSYPETEVPVLTAGRRYRLRFQNHSLDDHPLHLHRHSFELRSLPNPKPHGEPIQTRGIVKDTVLVDAGGEAIVEFTANNPGSTLMHCHQQNHMDLGFMMLFRYA